MISSADRAGLIHFERLTGDIRPFASFTFPRCRSVLAALPPSWIAFGARWRSMPAGLALARTGDGAATLHSLMVEAPLRQRGIATRMLYELAAVAREDGIASINTFYAGDLSARAPLEGALARAGFKPSTLEQIQLVGVASAMVEQGGTWPVIGRSARGIGEYTIEPMLLEGPGDDAAIRAILDADPEFNVAHPGSTAFDPCVSRVLRLRGAIVGWVAGRRLTRPLGVDTLVPGVSTFFYEGARIANGHARGLMLLLYYRAFCAQVAAHGPASRIVYYTHPRAPAMYAFTRQRFAPIALRLSETWSAVADLSPASPPTER